MGFEMIKLRSILFIFIYGLLQLTMAQGQKSAAHGWDLPQTEHYSQKVLLKNWALSVCLAQAYGDTKPANDANMTASAYFEYSNASDQSFDDLRKLAQKYAKLKYGGSVPGDFNTMKCIDLYNSKELDHLVKQMAPGK